MESDFVTQTTVQNPNLGLGHVVGDSRVTLFFSSSHPLYVAHSPSSSCVARQPRPSPNPDPHSTASLPQNPAPNHRRAESRPRPSASPLPQISAAPPALRRRCSLRRPPSTAPGRHLLPPSLSHPAVAHLVLVVLPNRPGFARPPCRTILVNEDLLHRLLQHPLPS